MFSFAAIGCSSCWLFEKNVIYVENNSSSSIDSLIIDANGTLVKFYNIPAGKKAEKTIEPPLKSNRDITMTPVFFIQGQKIDGTLLYNDLTGTYGSYKLTLSKKLEVTWEMVR